MQFYEITSRTNKKIADISALLDKKGRDSAGEYISEGLKLCGEAVSAGCTVSCAVVISDKYADNVKQLCENSGTERVLLVTRQVYDRVSADRSPDGVLFVVKKSEDKARINRDSRVFMLENVMDPGNVGTVIRSAAAFGFDTVILAGCADPRSPKAVRSSMGAVFKTELHVCRSAEDIIPVLKDSGRRIIAAALNRESLVLGNSELRLSDCPVVGNEGHGVSEYVLNNADECMLIPMTSKTESLNAAAAATVLMWEYSKTAIGVDYRG